MRPPRSSSSPVRRAVPGIAIGVAALAVLIFSLHGRALDYGLFMDDYAHVRQLRACDWSIRGLTDACRLELVGGVIELWWLPECTLRFFRPVAFGLMKLTYALVGWNAYPMHIASLIWHLIVCTLLMVVLRRLGVGVWLAGAVAALFAIHPGHVGTVQWIASQSELMVTTFLLAGLLCYMEFRGWPAGRGLTRKTDDSARWVWAAACVVFFAMALGCRENAIVLPLVLAALEPWGRRARPRGTLVLYSVLGLVAAIYLMLRWHYLGGAALPPRPYVVSPGEADFLRYVFDKACYYLLGEFLLVPCVPIGGLPYFRARPLVFYGLALLVVILLSVVCVRWWRRGAGALAVVWLGGFLLPVLPAFESPHHLYLPGVGWAVAAGLLLRGIAGAAADGKTRGGQRRRAAGWACALVTAVIFGVATHFFGLALDTAQRVEDGVADEIVSTQPELRNGDTLYVANLPVIAHYVKLAVEERTGLRDLRVVALTWAPRLLGLVGTATPSELTWVDERTIDVRIARERYFAGPLGLLAVEANGGRFPAEPQRPFRFEGFTVEVRERDARGIVALRFVFDDVPGRSRVHLFWGSRTCWAMEVIRKAVKDGE
jgi:hypothetical protein